MTFQEQQDKLLMSYLENYEKPNMNMVELIISSSCNQACEYCYLYKYGHLTYPPEANNKKNILHNLPLILNFFDDNNYPFETYDIFSGEFFQLGFWEDVFQIIYDHNIKVGKPSRSISIPTNMSFLMDKKKTKRVEYWIEHVKEANLRLYLSSSIDGPEDLEHLERPIKNGSIKQKDFYDTFFKFSAKYNFSSHPMITKNFVKNYKQNYDWWIDNAKKYNLSFIKADGTKVYGIPMMLEVRDSEQWNEESLQNYEKFLWYVAEKDLHELHNDNLEDFAWHMIDDFSDSLESKGVYNRVQPYILALPAPQNRMPCSIQSGPVVRVGDMALVPCHRTCYPDKVYGFFRQNEEKTKIIGVRGENPVLATKIKALNPNRSMLKCSDCRIKAFCLKGCLGSQFEHTRELFCPQDQVCELFKVKYRTINEIAKHYKVYDFLNRDFSIPFKRKDFINYARNILDSI